MANKSFIILRCNLSLSNSLYWLRRIFVFLILYSLLSQLQKLWWQTGTPLSPQSLQSFAEWQEFLSEKRKHRAKYLRKFISDRPKILPSKSLFAGGGDINMLYKLLTSQYKDMTSRHNYLTSGCRNMPLYILTFQFAWLRSPSQL